MLMALLPLTSCSQNKMNKTQESMKKGKTLVVYFSKAGENYAVGNIKKGNTRIIAEMIAEETDGTLFQIEPVKDYPKDYTKCTEVAQQELDSNARPAVKGDIDVENFDVVYIGYPIWYGEAPRIIYTFLDTYDCSGKTVIPFCTSSSSSIDGSIPAIKKLSPKAKWQNGIRFDPASTEEDVAKKLK